MKKISVFKVLCWFIVVTVLVFIVDTLAYNILKIFIGGLANHSIIYNLILLSASGSYGYYIALLCVIVAAKLDSTNYNRALVGSGAVLLIIQIIDKILSLLYGSLNVEISLIVSGAMLIIFGISMDQKIDNDTIHKGTVAEDKERIELMEENIEHYLLGKEKENHIPENDGYVEDMMNNCFSRTVTREQCYMFIGIIVINYYEGKVKALDAFDKLVKYWFVEVLKSSGSSDEKFKQYMTVSLNVSFFCGVLYSNHLVTKEESDALSQIYADYGEENVGKLLM